MDSEADVRGMHDNDAKGPVVVEAATVASTKSLGSDVRPNEWEQPALSRRVRRRIDWGAKMQGMGETAGGEKLDAAPTGDGGAPLVTFQELCRLPRPAPRVAIVTCMRACSAPRLREWLFWHIAEGACCIFIRWEGEMDNGQRQLLQGPGARPEIVLHAASTSRRMSSGFNAVMSRQIDFVHSSIDAARNRGIDFLVHLDDDELLCPKVPSHNLPEMFRAHVGAKQCCIHFQNLEAVFQFASSTMRPFSRPETVFRKGKQVLYCNGKSAANLTAQGKVFCSGVHKFCKFDRTFAEENPGKFGLHDDGAGCSHPQCCRAGAGYVLHFDSPSLEEWKSKFSARASARLTKDDHEEMGLFPFKEESVRAIRENALARANGTEPQESLEGVYRRWRCKPGREQEDFSDFSGSQVLERFHRQRSRLLLQIPPAVGACR
mmetsp:Transcript_52340/g.124964  ORF Transcript_52340/g.124964 Transcript_52340/m.124964 type:complete len:433 (+) Transcript_52340:48-1346(+)